MKGFKVFSTDGMKPRRGNQNNHICAKCGKRMKYAEKSTLYTFKVKPVTKWEWHSGNTRHEIESLAQSRMFAVNLCEECRKAAEDMIERWCGL